MKLYLKNRVLTEFLSQIEQKFKDKYPTSEKFRDYEFYGYPSGTGRGTNDYNGENLSAHRNRPSLKREMFEAFKNAAIDQLYQKICTKKFNGRYFRDKKKDHKPGPNDEVTLDQSYFLVYACYLFPDLRVPSLGAKQLEDKCREVFNLLKKKMPDLQDEINQTIYWLENRPPHRKHKGKLPFRIYFACFYTKDGDCIDGMEVSLDEEKQIAWIEKTVSDKRYTAEVVSRHNHYSIFGKADDTTIHLLLYAGRKLDPDAELVFGLLSIITQHGKAMSLNAVLQRLDSPWDKKGPVEKSIISYLKYRPFLEIGKGFEYIKKIRQLDQLVFENNHSSDLAGFYLALLVSKKKKSLISFAINISENGILQSRRKLKRGEIRDFSGIVYARNRRVAIMDISLNPEAGKSYSEYRFILDTSDEIFQQLQFIPGVYSGLNADKFAPRGGRVCLIPMHCLPKPCDNQPDDMALFLESYLGDYKIEKTEQRYKNLTNLFPSLEPFFMGEKDDFIENADMFLKA